MSCVHVPIIILMYIMSGVWMCPILPGILGVCRMDILYFIINVHLNITFGFCCFYYCLSCRDYENMSQDVEAK